MRSATGIGQHIGVHHRHVARRIARLIRAGAWPFDAPAADAPPDPASPWHPTGAVLRLAPDELAEPEPGAGLTLSLRISAALYTRLRGYCRRTGATVSETLEDALEGFLSGDAPDPSCWTPTLPPPAPRSRRGSPRAG